MTQAPLAKMAVDEGEAQPLVTEELTGTAEAPAESAEEVQAEAPVPNGARAENPDAKAAAASRPRGRPGKSDPLEDVLQLMEEKKFEQAATALELLLRKNPEDGMLAHNLGVVYTEQGLYEDAEKAFLKAFDIQKKDNKVNYATMFGLATVLTEQSDHGKLLQAEALFHDVLEHAVAQEEKGILETYRAFCGLSDNLERQKRWNEAAESWKASLELTLRMFGEEHERSQMHRARLARAERLARWQWWIRRSLWALTLAAPVGMAYAWANSSGQSMLSSIWGSATPEEPVTAA